tara:strand:+ start:723 stop:968 length:246 start_codon:yes stop_codon:yes gene_type:complete
MMLGFVWLRLSSQLFSLTANKKPGESKPGPVLHHKQAVSQLCDRVLHGSKRSLGDHAEIRRVDTLSALVVIQSVAMTAEQT